MVVGYKVVEFQETPNPNAVKCVVEPALSQPEGTGLRSYLSREAAAGDALGKRLMDLPGVSGVLIHQGWVTVSKRPEAEWKSVKAAVKKALADA